tara:strand:+ start:4370 stop:4939 length:570 start_codon:yes stop_codon:yes gene_type:complete
MTTIGLLDLHERAVFEYELGESDPTGMPFLEAERLFLATTGQASSGVSKRALNWTSKLYHYELFTAENGHTPRENTRNRISLPPEERRLGEWAGYQRRMQDRLTRFQRIRLDISTAFEWAPLDASWQARLAAYRTHVDATGRQPYFNSADPCEFRLATWAARQLHLMRSGSLPAERLMDFNSVMASTKS